MIVIFHLIPSYLYAQGEINDIHNDSIMHILPGNDLKSDSYKSTTGLYNLEITSNKEIYTNSVFSKERLNISLKNYQFPQTNNFGLLNNDYYTSAIVHQSRNRILIASGKQESFIGVGVANSANLGYQIQFNDRLFTNINLQTTKFSPYKSNNVYSFDADAMISYKIHDNITFNAFGSYSISNSFNTSHYGAFFSVDITRKFGTDLGVQRYYNPLNRKWDTVPIVAPYYKFNDKLKVGMDFGGIIQEVVRKIIE